MASLSIEWTSEGILKAYPSVREALSCLCTRSLHLLEDKCAQIDQNLRAHGTLDEDNMEALDRLHSSLLKDYIIAAEICCSAPALSRQNIFTDYSFDVRMWRYGIEHLITQLNLEHIETNQFAQKYLDKCKGLMDTLEKEVPSQGRAWTMMAGKIIRMKEKVAKTRLTLINSASTERIQGPRWIAAPGPSPDTNCLGYSAVFMCEDHPEGLHYIGGNDVE